MSATETEAAVERAHSGPGGAAPGHGPPAGAAAPAPHRPWYTSGEFLRLVVLFIVIVLPRFLFLDADPPGNLHIHFITDEGWWAHNARMRALFGHWIMDDHNPPLWSTPLYSFLLWIVYSVFGVGLYQTRILAALGGTITCFSVYGFVRREAGPGAAFASAMLLAVDYFLLTNNRVAFTESLQLGFATIAILAALRSRAGPWWGVVAAAGTIAAVLCKPNALAVGGVIGVFYLVMIFSPGRARADRAAAWRGAWVFTGAFVAIAAAVALFYVVPHWPQMLQEFESNLRIGMGPHGRLGKLARFLWFGYRYEPGLTELVPVGFLAQDAVLIACVGLLAVLRVLGIERRPLGDLEICCWIWLAVTLAFVTTQSYQPDRRYLLSVPPLAILLGMAATAPRGAREDEAAPVRPGRGRWLMTWLVMSLTIGVIGRPLGMPLLDAVTRNWKIGAEAGFGDRTMLAMIWIASFGLAAVILFVVARWRVLHRVAAPALAMLFVVLALDVARVAHGVTSTRFTIRDTSREIARLADALPPGRRVAVGNTADTFGLETDLFTFVVRDWPEADMYMNLDGIKRFKPSFAIVTMRRGVPVGDREGFDWDDMKLMYRLECWPDPKGKPRLEVDIYDPMKVHPDRPGDKEPEQDQEP